MQIIYPHLSQLVAGQLELVEVDPVAVDVETPALLLARAVGHVLGALVRHGQVVLGARVEVDALATEGTLARTWDCAEG